MNKNIFYLSIVLLIVISLFSAKIYFSSKQEALQESKYLVKLETKLKKVKSLKDKYAFNNVLFNRLKSFCKTFKKDDKYIVKCENLNPSKFNSVQNILFKNNFKLKKFSISKRDKLAYIEAEITK